MRSGPARRRHAARASGPTAASATRRDAARPATRLLSLRVARRAAASACPPPCTGVRRERRPHWVVDRPAGRRWRSWGSPRSGWRAPSRGGVTSWSPRSAAVLGLLVRCSSPSGLPVAVARRRRADGGTGLRRTAWRCASQGLGAGVPDPQTLDRRAAGHAGPRWGELLTTLPWVDLDGLAGAGALPARLPRAPCSPARWRCAPAVPARPVLAAARGRWRSCCCCGVPAAPAATLLGLVPRGVRRRRRSAGWWSAASGSRRAPPCSGAGHGRVGACGPGRPRAWRRRCWWPCRRPCRSAPTAQPASSGECLRGTSAAHSRTSPALDSPLRRFRTLHRPGRRQPGRTSTTSCCSPVTGAPAGQSGAAWSRSTGTTASEWLPGNDTMPGDQRRRLPAAGHRGSTTPVQGRDGSGPGDR